MRSERRTLWVLCSLSAALILPGSAHSLPTYTVDVSAPERSYSQTPVSVLVATPPAPAARIVEVTDLQTGEPVPLTVDPAGTTRAQVTWIVKDLGEGDSRRYRVAFSEEAQPDTGSSVELEELKDEGEAGSVAITIDGELFTRYVYLGAPKPYCYPIIGPTGAAVTRGYPMEEIPGESRDHHHHRSFWFTFGEVNGHDFWAETDTSGHQVHRAFEVLASGHACGVLRAANDWMASDGKKICEDVRELRVYNLAGVRLLDFAATIRATEGPVEFGDTKEGMFGFRIASTMRLKGGEGSITNAAGQRDDETWGKQAAWCDYAGPVNGQTAGIAIFDHPANLRHPTYWHVRNYGLFAANPFGLRHFVGDDTGAGRYTLPQGEELTFRYRVLIHPGSCEEARVADWYAEYERPPVVEVQADR